jgi:hypothetical protein
MHPRCGYPCESLHRFCCFPSHHCTETARLNPFWAQPAHRSCQMRSPYGNPAGVDARHHLCYNAIVNIKASSASSLVRLFAAYSVPATGKGAKSMPQQEEEGRTMGNRQPDPCTGSDPGGAGCLRSGGCQAVRCDYTKAGKRVSRKEVRRSTGREARVYAHVHSARPGLRPGMAARGCSNHPRAVMGTGLAAEKLPGISSEQYAMEGETRNVFQRKKR